MLTGAHVGVTSIVQNKGILLIFVIIYLFIYFLR